MIFDLLVRCARKLRNRYNPATDARPPLRGRVLFVGQCYYNHWYLSRELKKLGWRATVVNLDDHPPNQMYYHGQDIQFDNRSFGGVFYQLVYYFSAIFRYDIFVFSNAENLSFGRYVPVILRIFGRNSDVRFLKWLGKKIIYVNNGCRDGVSQTSFGKWGPVNVCSSCVWRGRPDVCSDARNLAWGKVRNRLADYQCLLGGNRVDFNDDMRVHEAPWAYSLDKNFWAPDLLIPANYHLSYPEGTVKLYHSVGNFESRSAASTNQTIKSTHIYLQVIERLQAAGCKVEMLFFHDVPNRKLRYYQAQADIFIDMLTYGWFGANVREALMLGKPAICYLRPEWLESMEKEFPDYVAELPVISATPDNVFDILKNLIDNPEMRFDIGRRSREFALKWHASDIAAKEFDRVVMKLFLENDCGPGKGN